MMRRSLVREVLGAGHRVAATQGEGVLLQRVGLGTAVERVTSAGGAIGLGGSDLSLGLGLRADPDNRAEASAAAAPRSDVVVVEPSRPVSALRESAPLPTAKPVATTAIDESVSEVLSAALGARRALEARCFGACGRDDKTNKGLIDRDDEGRGVRALGYPSHLARDFQVVEPNEESRCVRMTQYAHQPHQPRARFSESVTFSSISVTRAAIGERSLRVRVTWANRGCPLSFSTTATTPSCRPTRRLSRWATSWVSTTWSRRRSGTGP